MKHLYAIFLAIKTRQVFISLMTGIWLGWVVLSNFNLFYGTIATIDAIVNVFQDRGNTRVVLFTLLVGALIAFMQKSGGIEGFVNYMGKVISNDSRIILARTGALPPLVIAITNASLSIIEPIVKVQSFGWSTTFIGIFFLLATR